MTEQQDLLPPDNAELSALLANAGSIDPRVWPRTLSDLVDVYLAYFRRAGLDDGAAMTQAKSLIIVLSHYLGGRMIYLPQDEKLTAALRDAEIWRNPDGLSVRDLAARHGLTTTQIYGIMRSQRDINRSRD